MRYIKYLFLVCLALCLLVVALANRQVVLLKLLPDELAELSGLPFQLELPLFVVVFGGIVAGLLIGFVWEYLREYKHRAEASRKGREAKKLEREVKRLKDEKHEGEDDVLALLDEPLKAG